MSANLMRESRRWMPSPSVFSPSEKKDVIVDSFVKWRITDVAQYYRSTGGRITTASRLLSERINTSLRDEFGKTHHSGGYLR